MRTDTLIEFIKVNKPITSFERKVLGEISAINVNGDGLNEPLTIDLAKRHMDEILGNYYKLDRKYWSHKPLTVSVDQDGCWLLKVKFCTLIGEKICGFKPIKG